MPQRDFKKNNSDFIALIRKFLKSAGDHVCSQKTKKRFFYLEFLKRKKN